ncbi:hypothetical protein HPP92_022407 [Vanilla planifolia]|uniref:Fibronectin type III-like domain-containing protein n=1 Tax=Vanilla planifolia TaxID=51239 RepID=A0A835UDS4_VANPL|nr:hypothetical protein HPP92_022407 [Vanilla planifolia]
MNDMNMRANPSRGYPGRTYRFYEGETVYDFGYGLSYTNYSYRFLSAPNELQLPVLSSVGVELVQIDERISCKEWRFNVRILVENAGDVDGSHAVLVFVRPRKRMEGWPKKQLVGFERVFVASHRATEIRVTVDMCKQLGSVDGKGKRVLALGAHVLMVGHAEHVVRVSA